MRREVRSAAAAAAVPIGGEGWETRIVKHRAILEGVASNGDSFWKAGCVQRRAGLKGVALNGDHGRIACLLDVITAAKCKLADY